MNRRGQVREEKAKEILLDRGFTNIRKPADGIGDYLAEGENTIYRIEVKSVNSLIKGTVRKGLHIGLHRALRQQSRLVEQKEVPLFLVYFRKTSHWIFKSGWSQKVRPNDGSLF
jgi:hypothetical protein